MTAPGDSGIKFQVCNDLHVNFWIEGKMESIGPTQLYQWIDQVLRPDLHTNMVDGIILAGDVAPILWTPMYTLLECLIKRGYGLVIWIPGNHEYLSEKCHPSSIEQLNQYAQQRIDDINTRVGDRIFWLPHGILEFPTFNLIGTTLWTIPDPSDPKTVSHHMFNGETDPCIHTPGGANVVRPSKLDYGIHITNENGKTVPLNLTNYTQLALSQRAWLIQQYKLSLNKPLVVVTHYPPGRWMEQKGVNKRAVSMYVNDLPISFFPTNLMIWISGHTHFGARSKVTFDNGGSVSFISNPIGYPREYSGNHKSFDPHCVITI